MFIDWIGLIRVLISDILILFRLLKPQTEVYLGRLNYSVKKEVSPLLVFLVVSIVLF